MAEFVDVLPASVTPLETERVIEIVIEESSKEIERVEVVFLHRVRHRDVALFVQVLVGKCNSACFVIDHIALEVNQVAILVDCTASSVLTLLSIKSCKHKIASVVSVEVAHDIDFVE